MKILFAPIHWLVGGLIRVVDFATAPKPVQRPAEVQAEMNEACRSLLLYHYPACPFCVRVRREMRRLNLPVETRDPRSRPEWRQELEVGGGKLQVPCLRIDEADGSHRWLYESRDIVAHLQESFSSAD